MGGDQGKPILSNQNFEKIIVIQIFATPIFTMFCFAKYRGI